MARPRQINDEQILAAMRALVVERGPQVSLEVVARQLGVTAPALLRRFGSRQALLLQALQPQGTPEWMEVLEAGPDGRPFPAQLEEVLDRICDFYLEAIPCFSALRESGIPHQQLFPGERPMPLLAIQAVARWLQRCQRKKLIAGERWENVATALLGALQTRVFMAHLLKQSWTARSQRQYVRDVARLFSRALA